MTASATLLESPSRLVSDRKGWRMGTREAKQELAEVGIEAFTAREYKPGHVIHIVLFRFKPEVAEADVREVADRFIGLADAPRNDGAPYIVAIEAGAQNSGEVAGSDGFEIGFVVTFASMGDRNYYVGEPVHTDPRHLDGAHAAFKAFVGPLLATDGALVFDFTPGQF
jgi:hypothetical protein